jgi:hypothetical protein
MKKIIRNSVLLTILAVFASNCSDKVDLQGPYQENVYVFGLLDASQSTQKIKIYKVFSGANGTQSAQNLDSIYFKNGELDVKLEVYKLDSSANKLTNDIVLNYSTNSTLNNNGPFNPNDAVFYFTNTPIKFDYTYKLVINTNKNKRIESDYIKIADSCNFQTVFPSLPGFGQELVFRQEVYTFLDTTRIYKIKFADAKNVKGINCKMVMTYGNYDGLGFLQSKQSVQYDLKNLKFSGVGNENIEYNIDQNDFLKYWGENIPVDNSVFERRSLSMDFTFTTFDKETETFLAAQNESNGLSQEKLSYSNIKNGLGFIGSRNTITYYRSTTFNVDKVIGKSKYTRQLRFRIN